MCVDFAELKKDLRTELDALDHVLIIEQGSLRESTMKALQEEKFQVVEMPFRPTRPKILPDIFMNCLH